MIRKLLLITIVTTALAGCANTIDTDQVKAPEDAGPQAQVAEKPEVTAKVPTESSTKSTPLYADFSQEKYSELLGKKPFALFFHAPWCETCRKMEKDITADLNSFPKGTIILKADFDSETALRKKYGITSQSLIVIVNAKGEAVATLVAPNNTKLKDAIQKSL